MIPVNTNRALELFQNYLRKVAEHLQASEHNTNNILASLVS